jgi:hypothetical protein
MMSRWISLVFVLVTGQFLVGASCWPVVPKPDHSPDAAVRGTCSTACANLRRLNCAEGQPLPDGTTCEAFCERTEREGHAMNTSCVASVTSCSRLRSVCGM